jgi:hypothetical protein
VMASEFVERMTGELRFPVPRKLLKRTVRFFLNRITRDRIVVCSILEDSPDRDNRVCRSQGRMNYGFSIESSRRTKCACEKAVGI